MTKELPGCDRAKCLALVTHYKPIVNLTLNENLLRHLNPGGGHSCEVVAARLPLNTDVFAEFSNASSIKGHP